LRSVIRKGDKRKSLPGEIWKKYKKEQGLRRSRITEVPEKKKKKQERTRPPRASGGNHVLNWGRTDKQRSANQKKKKKGERKMKTKKEKRCAFTWLGRAGKEGLVRQWRFPEFGCRAQA